MKNKTMKTNMKKHSLAFLLLAVSSVSYAEGEKVQHGAHVHGVADMNIVWDKKDLNIELKSPSYNIIGFGHKPTNHEQEETIEKAEKKLNSPNELFGFVGPSCKLVKTKIESPFEDHNDKDEHAKHEDKDEHDEHAKHKDKDEHDEHAKHDDKEEHDEHAKHDDKEEHDEHAKHDDKDEHDEHAKHDDKDDHDEHAKHEDHDEHDHEEGDKSSSHSEYSIHYEFSCTDNKEGLTVSTANLFEYFPHMEKIKVQWLSATQQSSSILTKKNNTVKLK